MIITGPDSKPINVTRSRVFIPYHQMCMFYPCLWKLPFLLPVFWVVRLVGSLFNANKRRKLKIELTAVANKKKNG